MVYREYSTEKDLQKLNIFRTLIIGLGFFASSMFWAVYNPYIQNDVLTITYGFNTAIVGVVMVLDNVFGVLLQPWIGTISDKTRSRFGRRMPYILIGVPIAAFLFILIPWVITIPDGFWLFFTILLGFNFMMAIFRSPAVAMMPDLTAPKFRSSANGLINLMGGLATIIIFTLGGVLSKIKLAYVFYFGAIVATASMLLLYRQVKEPREPIKWMEISNSGQTKESGIDQRNEKQSSTIQNLRDVFRNPNSSGLYMFLAIFFWFFAYNLIESFGAIFFGATMGLTTGTTTLILSAFLLTFILFSLPAGKIAEKYGRRKTILVGILILLITFVILAFVVHMGNLVPVILLFLIAGCGWAMININSIAIVWSLTSAEKIGAYTGLYYFFSFMAQIIGPVLGGLLFVVTDIKYAMFPFALAFFAVAGFCMTRVKAGEIAKETVADRAKKEALM